MTLMMTMVGGREDDEEGKARSASRLRSRRELPREDEDARVCKLQSTTETVPRHPFWFLANAYVRLPRRNKREREKETYDEGFEA